jgi:hypothetical protein
MPFDGLAAGTPMRWLAFEDKIALQMGHLCNIL